MKPAPEEQEDLEQRVRDLTLKRAEEAAERFILAAAGVVQEALERVDLGRLQQFLAARRSA